MHQHTFNLFRPRLVQQLTAETSPKVAQIVAPVGYGKTLLARQAAEYGNRPFLWHTLNTRDRDIASLQAVLISAIKHQFPNVRVPDEITGASPLQLASEFAEVIRTIQQDLLFILDDVHILEASEAEMWLAMLIEQLPATARLLLCSRTLPRLEQAASLKKNKPLQLGTDELKFSREDIQLVAQQLGKQTLDADQLAEVETQLDGWPIGTVLWVSASDHRSHELTTFGSPEEHFNSLVQTLFETLPPPLQKFLLTSSTLAHLIPEQLAEILNLRSVADYLAEAHSRNLFISSTPEGLTYHNLFRQFLQSQLLVRAPHEYVALHLQAARKFEIEGRLDEAVTHYLNACEDDYARQLVNRLAEPFLIQGKREILLAWQQQFKQRNIQSARLTYTCGIIHRIRLKYTLAESEFLDAESLATAEAENDELFLANIALQRADVSLLQARFDDALLFVDKALVLSGDIPVIQGRIDYIIGSVHLARGQLTAALTCFQKALPVYRALTNVQAFTQLLQSLSTTCERLGRIQDASQYQQEAVALLRAHHMQPELALALVNQGYYHLLNSNYSVAQQAFDEGLKIVAKFPMLYAEVALLWNLGDLLRDSGQFTRAYNMYSHALQVLQKRDNSLYCSILLSMAQLARIKERFDEVQTLTTEVQAIAHAGNLQAQAEVANLLYWLCKASDNPVLAFEGVASAIARLSAQNARLKLLLAYSAAADVASKLKKKRLAITYLTEALKLTNDIGSGQILAVELSFSEALRTLAVGLPDAKSVLAELEMLDTYKKTVSADIKLSVVPMQAISLSVQSLGREAFLKNSVRIPISNWRSSTARRLFFYLLLNGAATRERISEEFWPDANVEMARDSFHTTLKRAKHALGEDIILLEDDMYQINDQVRLTWDAREFETLIQNARAHSKLSDYPEDLYERALTLYHGDFLKDYSDDWIFSYREKLQSSYLDALIAVSGYKQKRQEYKHCINLLKRGLQVEPYREDIHRQLMIVYAESGMRKKVIEHYGAFRTQLQEELGIEPEHETRQLFYRLVSN